MKAINNAISKNKDSFTSTSPILLASSELSTPAARIAPLHAITSARPSSVMNVTHTRPGCIGEKYGK